MASWAWGTARRPFTASFQMLVLYRHLSACALGSRLAALCYLVRVLAAWCRGCHCLCVFIRTGSSGGAAAATADNAAAAAADNAATAAADNATADYTTAAAAAAGAPPLPQQATNEPVWAALTPSGWGSFFSVEMLQIRFAGQALDVPR
jgi:hypothetical protein